MNSPRQLIKISVGLCGLLLMFKVMGRVATVGKINQNEQILLKVASQQKMTPEQRYHHYLLAARHLLDYRYLGKAEKYYRQALELKINSKTNKEASYLGLISIGVRKGDLQMVKDFADQFIRYMSGNRQFVTPSTDLYMKYLKTAYLGSATAQERRLVYNSFYGSLARKQYIATQMRGGKYANALKELPRAVAKRGDSSLKVTYDLLNVAINKRKVKKLLCSIGQKRRSPSNSTYSNKICRVLKGFIKSGKIKKHSLVNLEQLLEKHFPQKRYLVATLRHLEMKI